MRDAQAALCVGLVDHVLGDFELADAIRVIDFSSRVWFARRIVGVARVADALS